MHPSLFVFLLERYPVLKQQYPADGRRALYLRALSEFWRDAGSKNENPNVDDIDTDLPFEEDLDPFDEIVDGTAGGLLVRTDFTEENAWLQFLAKFRAAENEIKQDTAETNPEHNPDVEKENDDGSESGDESDAPLIQIVNPSTPDDQVVLLNISNFRALCLLNDVNVRAAPTHPPETKRISPPNRLVDRHGWQQVFSGPTLWIYDSKSNSDQCLRLVGSEGDVYGTATGDSWRAQVSHIFELQYNMTFLGMKINFGGMDRWDYSERKRNLDEAEAPL